MCDLKTLLYEVKYQLSFFNILYLFKEIIQCFIVAFKLEPVS